MSKQEEAKLILKLYDLRVIKDWDIIDRLNPLIRTVQKEPRSLPDQPGTIESWVGAARAMARDRFEYLNLAFRVPELSDFMVLWPAGR